MKNYGNIWFNTLEMISQASHPNKSYIIHEPHILYNSNTT